MTPSGHGPRGQGEAASVPFIGLTGALGAGKSETLHAFARLGAATLSSDAVVHDLLKTPELVEKVAERFGSEVISENEVDRSAVAGLVFSDSDKRRWLEDLLWPRVAEEIARWKQTVDASTPRPPAAVVEVPLLFEAGLADSFDYTVTVVCDDKTRTERVASKGDDNSDRRADQQLSQQEKAQRADFVIANDASLGDLEAKVAELLAMMTT